MHTYPCLETRSELVIKSSSFFIKKTMLGVCNRQCLIKHGLANRKYIKVLPSPKKKKTQDDQAIYMVSKSRTCTQIPYRCSRLNAYYLLSCRDTSTLLFCLCRPTVTIHQGQSIRHDVEHICHAYT